MQFHRLHLFDLVYRVFQPRCLRVQQPCTSVVSEKILRLFSVSILDDLLFGVHVTSKSTSRKTSTLYTEVSDDLSQVLSLSRHTTAVSHIVRLHNIVQPQLQLGLGDLGQKIKIKLYFFFY